MKLGKPLLGIVLFTLALGPGIAVAQGTQTKPVDDRIQQTKMDDLKFVQGAAQGHMFEIRLGRWAKEHGSSEFTRHFGEMMAKDHEAALADLRAWAKESKINLPYKITKDQKQTIERLSKLTGDDFDKGYYDEMLKDHRADYELYTKMSKDALNPHIQGYAQKYAPIVKQHLDMLENHTTS